jgi:photosystem II stability/assembly factor-like uncharacterized protein
MTTPDPGASDDRATQALEDLIRGLDSCIAQLQGARTRARQLLAQRQAGRAWLDIVVAEKRPLVVERVSAVLATLADAGSAWRREEAAALRREQVSINRIAALFGVTRQRISALLQPPAP